MVIPRQPLNEIPADECKKLIELIYYGHYLKWYARVWPSYRANSYKGALDKCFEVVSRKIGDSAFVRLNGGVVAVDEAFPGQTAVAHARNFTYVAFLLIPLALTLAISLAQEFWLTIGTFAIS